MNWKQRLAEHFGYKSFDDMDTTDRSIAEWIEKNVVASIVAEDDYNHQVALHEAKYELPISKADDDAQFKQYVRRERDAFVRFINELEWNRPLRTACENLLIAYDQMRDRL